MNSADLDQTIFSQEQQLVNETGTPIAPVSATKRKRVALFLGLGLILFGMILIALISRNRTPKTQITLPSPPPTAASAQNNSYLDQLFDELQDQVDAADPSENILPFPPIEADIRIESPKVR